MSDNTPNGIGMASVSTGSIDNTDRSVEVQDADTTREVGETEVAPGGSTTVELSVDFDGELGELEIVRIDDQFDPGFADIEVTSRVPGGGEGGPGPDNEELIAVWNEEAEEYSLSYEVTLPADADPGDEFEITGTLTIGDDEEALPSETIIVVDEIPDETGLELRPSDASARSDDEVTLDIVVTGPDDGISGFDVALETDDVDVATFADYELTNDAEIDDSEVADDGSLLTLDVDLLESHEEDFSVTIAEVTLEARGEGQAAISIDQPEIADSTGDEYDLETIEGATISVTEEVPAEFELGNLVAPDEIEHGTPYEVTVEVTNIGETPGTPEAVTYTVLDGDEEVTDASGDLDEVAPDETTTVTFEIDADAFPPGGDVPGTYQHAVMLEASEGDAELTEEFTLGRGVATYADEDKTVNAQGVLEGFADWQAGEIPAGLFLELFAAWQDGSSVI